QSLAKARTRCPRGTKARLENRPVPDLDDDPARVPVTHESRRSAQRNRKAFHWAHRIRLRSLSLSGSDGRGRSDCCTYHKASCSRHRKALPHAIDAPRKTVPATPGKSCCLSMLQQRNRPARANESDRVASSKRRV